MKQWLKYFLAGIEQTTALAVQSLSDVLRLKSDLEAMIMRQFGRRSHTAVALLQELFQNPFITVEQAAKICNMSYKAANDLVALMVEHKILTEMTG